MTLVKLKDILVNHGISDIEVCYLETLSFSDKFNLVILNHDLTHRNIENIESIRLVELKEQLIAQNIKYAEGLPLNWGHIMESVRENPRQFREAGSWEFLHNMEVDWIIKMEPGYPLSCSSCAEKVPPDHEDIEQENYLFFCRNCPQPEDRGKDEKTISGNTNARRRKREDEKDPGRDKTQLSSKLLKDSTKASSVQKTEKSKQATYIPSSTENLRLHGPPSKKLRKKEDVSDKTESSVQRIASSDASPALRSVGQVVRQIPPKEEKQQRKRGQQQNVHSLGDLRKVKINNNNNKIQDHDTNKVVSGGEETPSSQQPPAQKDEEGRKKSQNRRLSEAGGEPKTRSQETPSRRRILDLLEHSSRCQETECELAGCVRLKKIVSHVMDCRRLDCHLCRPMTDVLCVHAKLCEVVQCPVPLCLHLSQKSRGLQRKTNTNTNPISPKKTT